MTDQRFTNIWHALAETPAQAANMTLRSDIMIAITAYIDRSALTQTQAAVRFGVTQPRISDLKRGKIGLFSLDMLVNMLATAGLTMSFDLLETAPAKPAAPRRRNATFAKDDRPLPGPGQRPGLPE